jgi:hypothetical protein
MKYSTGTAGKFGIESVNEIFLTVNFLECTHLHEKIPAGCQWLSPVILSYMGG